MKTRFSYGALTALSVLAAVGAAHAGGGGNKPAAGLTPDDALALLQQGNARFVNNAPHRPNADAYRRHETATHGQHPFAIVLSCADSRAPVETVFDRGVGDLFVVRVAGNVCDGSQAGSIEYAAAHLGSPLIVVMGHTACGAVTAVATGAHVDGNVPHFTDNIAPAVETAQRANPTLKGADLVPEATEANVWQSIEDLLSSSELARGLVAEKKVKVVGAVYDLATGEVRWLGEHPSLARVLARGGSAEPARAEPRPAPSRPAATTDAQPAREAPHRDSREPTRPAAKPHR